MKGAEIMGIYEKYKGSGIYYIKYPYSKDPSTDRIRYKIEKVGPKKLAERFFNKKMTEWAEKKCAVPAETIEALSRLVAEMRPAWLWSHWGVSRKSHGEQAVRAFAALQATLGYWGVPGAGPTMCLGPKRDIPI